MEALVEEIVEEFKHPKDLIIDSTKNIFWHGKAIAGALWHSVIDFDN
jgi:hypothetical protein